MPERILLTHVKDYETNGRQELARAFRFVNVGDRAGDRHQARMSHLARQRR